MTDWDQYYLDNCEFIARKSKDPSTKVGAFIVRPNHTVASLGWNGFPRGVKDTPERYADRAEKYPRVVHAELNAILMAREPLHGYTIYVSPLYVCTNCAGAIIQSGISKVICQVRAPKNPSWEKDFEITRSMFAEAGVDLILKKEPDYAPPPHSVFFDTLSGEYRLINELQPVVQGRSGALIEALELEATQADHKAGAHCCTEHDEEASGDTGC